MYEKGIKKIIDIVLSFIGAVVLLPVFLIISAAVYIDDPGLLFFRKKEYAN